MSGFGAAPAYGAIPASFQDTPGRLTAFKKQPSLRNALGNGFFTRKEVFGEKNDCGQYK